jgi:spore germination cell wall hydrolase CwlJ-like protein
MGLALGAAYLAGGAAKTSLVQARAARLAEVLSGSFSDQALRTQTAQMDPGAVAVARRHDPFPGAEAPAGGQAAPVAAVITNPAKAERPQVNVTAARPFQVVSDDPASSARALECLSDAVYYEARGENASGQAAVAQVVLNRVRHPAFPRTVCGVVFQGAQSHACQFSFACNGAMRRPKEPGAWRRAQAVAARALGGFVMAEVGDATHFHVVGLGGIWGGQLLRVARIGAHVFYQFAGRSRLAATPVAYAAASGLTGRPVGAAVQADLDAAPDRVQPETPALMLAVAATIPAPAPAGQGGPAGPVSEPASAPKPDQTSVKPVAANVPTSADTALLTGSPRAAS